MQKATKICCHTRLRFAHLNFEHASCASVCKCVKERERKRERKIERERERERERESVLGVTDRATVSFVSCLFCPFVQFFSQYLDPPTQSKIFKKHFFAPHFRDRYCKTSVTRWLNYLANEILPKSIIKLPK